MPEKKCRVVDERLRFIAACSESEESVAELCRRFGISRKTGYKWLDRYDAAGPPGLLDRPPVAHVHPASTPLEVVDALVAAREAHPTWGPRKLRGCLNGCCVQVCGTHPTGLRFSRKTAVLPGIPVWSDIWRSGARVTPEMRSESLWWLSESLWWGSESLWDAMERLSRAVASGLAPSASR